MHSGEYGGLFQPNQHVVRYNHRVLHRREMPDYVSQRQIRVQMGRRAADKEAHSVLGAAVHRLSHDVGARSIG